MPEKIDMCPHLARVHLTSHVGDVGSNRVEMEIARTHFMRLGKASSVPMIGCWSVS